MVEIFAVDFGDGKRVAAKVAGEFEEGDVFFADVIEDADGGGVGGGEADDLASGASQLALQRLDAIGASVKMLFEKLLENVHRGAGCRNKDNIEVQAPSYKLLVFSS